MSTSAMISIILGGVVIILGIFEVATGKVIGNYSKRFTAESVKAFARKGGAAQIVFGVMFLLADLSSENLLPVSPWVRWLFLVGLVITVIVYTAMYKNILEKKPEGAYDDEEDGMKAAYANMNRSARRNAEKMNRKSGKGKRK